MLMWVCVQHVQFKVDGRSVDAFDSRFLVSIENQ